MSIFALTTNLLIFVAVVLLVWAGWTVAGEFLTAYYHRRKEFFNQNLTYLFIKDTTVEQVILYVLSAAGGAALLAWLASSSFLFGLIVFVGMLFVPDMVFNYLHEQRRTKIEEGLPAALDQMVSSAKAGLNLAQLLEDVERKGSPPVSEEIGLIMQEYRLGQDLETAIKAANERLGSKMFTLFASALLINRQKGGNLPEALETMSDSFKEISRLEQKVFTASSEGRKGVRVISIMPLFIFGFIMMAQPELIETLTSNFVGWAMIAVAISLYVLALMWLRKILAIDI